MLKFESFSTLKEYREYKREKEEREEKIERLELQLAQTKQIIKHKSIKIEICLIILWIYLFIFPILYYKSIGFSVIFLLNIVHSIFKIYLILKNKY